jgi:threonine aldolase
MREAMFRAEVDDDILEHDPTTLRLEERSAGLLGKEAALFVPSGTMANQVCVKAFTKPGQQILCSETSHVAIGEVCASAALAGVQPCTVPSPNGYFTAEAARKCLYADVHYLPETGLISVENTMNGPGGRVFPQDETEKIAAMCREKGIPLHVDGARLFNAAVASGLSASEIVRNVDAVCFCLSKGLGAPAGSMVVGDRALIRDARRIRQMFGGGMRQTGILAAAGLYALEHNIERLAEDHANARLLAEGLAAIPGMAVDLDSVETNMVYVDTTGCGLTSKEFAERLGEFGIRILYYGSPKVRLVTHLDVSRDDILLTLECVRKVVAV